MGGHSLPPRESTLPRPVMAVALGLIVLLGLFLRLYRLDELVLYLGDQGRDMTVVSEMVSSGEPVLLGPGSGFGQFQRGPAYYYLLVAGWASGGGNPAGAAATLAGLDAATIFLMFVAGRLVGSTWTGLVAAALYATSGAVISLSRAFLNPNVLPFFSILVFVSLALLVQNRSRLFPVLIGALVLAWQMHDQTWLLVLWSAVVLVLLRPPLTPRVVLAGIAVALTALAPFLWHELQNDFVNVRAILEFVGGAVSGSGADIGGVSLPERLVSSIYITQGMLLFDNGFHWLLVGGLIASIGLIFLRVWRAPSRTLILLALYTLLPLFYLIWPGPLYASYLAILAPVPILALAFGVGRVMAISHTAARVAGIGVVLVCLAASFSIFVSIQHAVPAPESLGAARAGVEYMLEQVPSGSFLWRIEKRDPITHELEVPWRYLLEWRGARVGTGPQPDGFAVYMPAAYAPSVYAHSPVIAGNRIVHLIGPTLGRDVLRGGAFDSADDLDAWSLRTTGQTMIDWDANERALRLDGSALTGDLMAVRRFNAQPDTDYAVELEYRNALTRGSQRVYFLCLDADRNFVSLAPQPGGLELESSATWQRGLLWVRTPPECVRVILWLRQEGVGAVWFRSVSARPMSWRQIDGQAN